MMTRCPHDEYIGLFGFTDSDLLMIVIDAVYQMCEEAWLLWGIRCTLIGGA